MNAAAGPGLVAGYEQLARFIFWPKHVYANGTPKPNAFLPDKMLELSTTRHLQLTQGELWDIGRAVGAVSHRILNARSDVIASAFFDQKLRVVAAPTANNLNHANVIDWPLDKASQKTIAQQIAAAAGPALPAPPA